MNIKSPKKLIEVALPLDKINIAAAREKSIRHGHPSTLHLWWARRPLAAARAVLFAQLVNDPGYERHLQRGMNKEKAAIERERLFRIIEKLVLWENTNNEEVLNEARAEIWKSWRETCHLNRDHPQAAELFNPDKLPAFHDPFAGGGAIPLEAQRLGLESYASDLNPVAVLINKAMIEIPPKFAGRSPVYQEEREDRKEERGVRKKDALSRTTRVAEGDGSGERGVSLGAKTSEGGNLRDALTNNEGDSIHSSEYSRGLDKGISEREGSIPGDSPGFTGRDRDTTHTLRTNRMVSGKGNNKTAGLVGRSEPHVDGHAPKSKGEEKARVSSEDGEVRNEEREMSSEKGNDDSSSFLTPSSPLSSPQSSSFLSPDSSFLFPSDWSGAKGLAEDVRRYGKWMRDEAEKRIGHLYPKIEISPAMVLERPDLKAYEGKKLTVIAWLWARTVKSPNPAYSHVQVPLASTFVLSSKAGKEAYIEVEKREMSSEKREDDSSSFLSPSSPLSSSSPYRFIVKMGTPPDSAKGGTTAGKRHAFLCLMSGAPIDYDFIRTEGKAGRMGEKLMAIVAEGTRGRVYLNPTKEMEEVALSAKPTWVPDSKLPVNPRDFKTPNYGLNTFADLFTPRQLVALTTFSDLVQEAREKVLADALKAWEVEERIEKREKRAEGEEERIEKREKRAEGEEERIEKREKSMGNEENEASNASFHASNGQDEASNASFHASNDINEASNASFHASNDINEASNASFRASNATDEASFASNQGSSKAKQASKTVKKEQNAQKVTQNPTSPQSSSFLTPSSPLSSPSPDSSSLLTPSSPLSSPSPDSSSFLTPSSPLSSPSLLPLSEGGTGPQAYADAVAVYLGFAVDKATDYWSTICTWHSSKELIRNTFGRQAIPMTWDYVETNIFSDSSGNVSSGIEWAQKAICMFPAGVEGFAVQGDAQRQTLSKNSVVSTDPPYYDNIGYADLSDFFYVWLRKSLRPVFPNLFATLAVPKAEELVATPYRHGSKKEAEDFFLDGMTLAIRNICEQAHPAFPVTIYYAFKSAETKENSTSSTGWETFLDAVISAGFSICGTWPMRTELGNRMISSGTNALASSIILVCRKRAADAATVSRRDFIRELNEALPIALDEMTRGGVNSPVAPVDLSQAIIGPGMAIFSKYEAVLEADGSRMSVRTALQLINRFLAEDDFDGDTQFCLHWFENYGWSEGKYGEADTLARAKGTSVEGIKIAGVLESGKGAVRLLRWAEYPADWNPLTDQRTPIWEALHQLIRALNQQGETAAGTLLAAMPAKIEPIRQLSYRLYTLCERKGWAEEARAYNELMTAWSGVESAAQDVGITGHQTDLGF